MARFEAFERSVLAIAALFLAGAPLAQAQTPAPAQPAAAAAAPNWSRVRDTAQFGISLDLNSIRPTAAEPGHARLVDAAGLLDFKVAQILNDHQVASVKYVMSFDCGQKQLKLLTTTYYEQNMAAGRVISADEASDAWHAPALQTPEAPLLTAACGPK